MPPVNFRTLSQLNGYLQKIVEEHLGGKEFWLKTEISNVNFHRSGHAYLNIIEQKDGKILAQSKAMIWSNALLEIKSDLKEDFDNILSKGKEILALVSVSFHPEYGMSVSILKVDINFSIGELEKRRQDTLKKLNELQLLEANKQKYLPIVIQNIAIIGAIDTSGYKDFIKQLENNQYGFHFSHDLFHASVQGKTAIKEIVSRLNELNNKTYDAVVIIRGGGSKLDLEAFDSFEVANAIATHNLPILTGIGHETDFSLSDLVAKENFKTPSALGSYIVERANNYITRMGNIYQKIRKHYHVEIERQNKFIKVSLNDLRNKAIGFCQLKRGKLHQIGNRIVRTSKTILSSNSEKLKADLDSIKYYSKTKISTASNLLALTRQKSYNSAIQIIRNSRSCNNEFTLKLINAVNKNIEKKENGLQKAEINLHNIHPNRILKRGFSITRKGMNAIDSLSKLKEGDLLEIELYKRKIYAQFINDEPKWKKLTELLTRKPQKN